jgi:hypothetical protein
MNFTLKKPDGSFSWGSLLAMLATMVGGVAASAPAGSKTSGIGTRVATPLAGAATFVH